LYVSPSKGDTLTAAGPVILNLILVVAALMKFISCFTSVPPFITKVGGRGSDLIALVEEVAVPEIFLKFWENPPLLLAGVRGLRWRRLLVHMIIREWVINVIIR